jgi:CheY-like chemotaxis protein
VLRTILVADDSSTIRRIVELTFSDTDVRVEAVSSGREALVRIDGLRPDLVLADVALSEPSGYELCRTIKSSPRPVPVVLLSGSFDPFDRERARECGADGHLVKPFESSVLRERVTEMLRPPARREAPPPPTERAAVEPVSADPLPPPPEPAGPPAAWVDAVAREVVARLSDRVVREVAREIVPRLAREMIRERIRELETRDDG